MQLPSKKLLSEVLGVNIKDIYKIGSNPNLSNNILPYSIRGCGDLEEINIYELSHKCKKWAEFIYKVDGSEIKLKSYGKSCEIYTRNHAKPYILKDFDAKTEPEAIFKACEWVLNNKDK